MQSNTIYDLQLQTPIVLRMQPLQCVSQHHVANLHVSTHMATPDDNNHAAIPMRSATADSKTPYNYAHTHKHSQSSLKPPLQCGNKKSKPTAAAPAAHRRYLSSPPAATLHGKMQGFVLRLPPNTSPMQHSCKSILL